MLVRMGRLMGRGGTGFVPGPRIRLSSTVIAENAEVNDVIGTLSVANGSGSYTFSITADPDGKFNISGTDLRVDAALDYETATSHQVTIEADNGVDPPISRTFTIRVTNVLEVTLAALSLDADEIEENSAEDTVVGAIVGASSGSTVSLLDSAGGRFKLSGGNEAATSYEITLRETHSDASNSPRDTVIEITILDDESDNPVEPEAPLVLALTPPDDATDVAVDAVLTVQFDQAVEFGDAVLIRLYKAAGDVLVQEWTEADIGLIAVDGDTLEIIPSADLDYEEGYYVTIAAGSIESLTGTPFAGISGTAAWNFTTAEEVISEPFHPLDLSPELFFQISDLSTLKQERTGSSATTPAGVGDPVGSIQNLGTLGGWAMAEDDSRRMILRQTGGGKYYLEKGDSGSEGPVYGLSLANSVGARTSVLGFVNASGYWAATTDAGGPPASDLNAWAGNATQGMAATIRVPARTSRPEA